MNLPEYIEKIGDDQAAALFEVKKRTVASWRRRERMPRPHQAQRIIARTGGALSWEGIYDVTGAGRSGAGSGTAA